MDLKRLYNDPSFSASFAGKNRFYKAARLTNQNVSKKSVEKSLKAIDSYTLHKPTQKSPLYRRVFTKGIGYLYEADLVDMSKFKNENDGYTFLITIIDTFSKKAWAFKLKRKTAKSIVGVMTPFLRNNKPQKISFDQGTEFYNKLFLDLLKKHGIKHYSVYSDRKCSIVERFNRTLKTRMYRYFTARGSHRWIDVLEDLVNGYNDSKHRSTSFPPNAINKSNEKVASVSNET